jgi:hypothetical protein
MDWDGLHFLSRDSSAAEMSRKRPARFELISGLLLPALTVEVLTDPSQFYEELRVRALNAHRWLGRFYLLEVGLGSIVGFAMRSFPIRVPRPKQESAIPEMQ